MEGGLGVDWLGGYLAVCGLGLLGLVEEGVGGREKECGGWGEEEIRARDTLPRGEGRELLGRSWLDGALQALYSSGLSFFFFFFYTFFAGRLMTF